MIKPLGVCCLFLLCITVSGCVWSSVLSTDWSDNIALTSYGTQATHPALNDGKRDTIATATLRNKERVFGIKFDSVKPVRRIVIYNHNLFRFDVDYRDTKASEPKWKNAHSVRQRRGVGDQRAQPKFVIDRLNFQTDVIRIKVSRTVDDRVISKPIADPDDMIVDHIRRTVGGRYVEYFRVIAPSIAAVNEIEVYHLAAE
ncbi:MAG: hypothetical protein OXN17_06695 [Candidatus Poribacteria bacterium]|nr:hypothetical protein [Candidatus Poribacteria bacterium]MDE0504325.1 hypothetical protein [Candidatus Poribacteria bacterium]